MRRSLQRVKRNRTDLIRLAHFLQCPPNSSPRPPSGDRSKAVMVIGIAKFPRSTFIDDCESAYSGSQ
jgi:hypothetical protein